MEQVTKQKIARMQAEIVADTARTQQNIASTLAGVQQYQANVGENITANRSAALGRSSQQF